MSFLPQPVITASSIAAPSVSASSFFIMLKFFIFSSVPCICMRDFVFDVDNYTLQNGFVNSRLER